MAKDNKKNKCYTKEFKESVLKRLEPPTNDTITSLSKELDIPRTTIYQWTQKKGKNSINHKSSSKWTSEDKFHAVLKTATLTEEELAQYCRRKGIYAHDINFKEEKEKNKKLEKELRRKEKALAETAVLLILRKKANTIWRDPEEE